MCHAVEPVWESIVTAPKAVLLDRPEHIHRNAKLIGLSADPVGRHEEWSRDIEDGVAWLKQQPYVDGQERHHLIGALGAAEREQQHGVVRAVAHVRLHTHRVETAVDVDQLAGRGREPVGQ